MTLPSFTPLLAEISDKVPSIPAIWMCSFVLTAVVIGCRRFSRWSLVVTVPLMGWVAFSVWREFVVDTYFRQAVVAELGHGYLIQVVSAGCIPLIAVLVWSARDLNRMRAEQTRCSEPGGSAPVDNRGSVTPGR